MAKYNSTQISTILRYRCKHCLFNNTYDLYVEETDKELICLECNMSIESKFIRGRNNGCFHINCFNKNPTILRNEEFELYQCKMCDKYININECNITYIKLPNECDIYKDILSAKIHNTRTYIDKKNEYTLLFIAK